MISRGFIAAALVLAPCVAQAQVAQPWGTSSVARVSAPPVQALDNEAPEPAAPVVNWRSVRSPWYIAFDTHLNWFVDPRADVFNTNHPTVVGPGVSIARDIVRLGANSALAIGLGYLHASTDGLVAQSIDTRLESNALVVDVAARTEWLSWLTPSVRLAGEAMRFDTTVAASSGHPLTGGTWSALGTLGAALTVHTPAALFEHAQSFMLGLKLEAGYELGSPVSLDVAPQPPTDATAANDRIAIQPTHVGTFVPHGPYLRISAMVRF